MNAVTLIGRMTRDPESTESKSGTKICRMGIAVDNAREDGQTLFIDVVAFARQATTCQQFLGKGDLVGVEGRLDFNQWNGPDGKQRSKHSVIANRVEFLEKRLGRAKGAAETIGERDELAEAA